MVLGGDSGIIGRVDFAYKDARLVLEADSRRHHSSWLDAQADRRRDAALLAAGWYVLRVTWDQLVRRPDEFVAAVRSALRRAERKRTYVGTMCPDVEVSVEEQARALADGVEATLPGWVERSVRRVLVTHQGWADPEVMASARAAGERARADVVPRVRALLSADIEDQRTNPLSLLRQAVRYPTEVLRQAGVPPVQRDRFSEERFPDDDYDLTPASFSDVDPALFEPGVEWGAAKAWLHKQRHSSGR